MKKRKETVPHLPRDALGEVLRKSIDGPWSGTMGRKRAVTLKQG